jgi:dolichol-phosphate mannosyltransferase
MRESVDVTRTLVVVPTYNEADNIDRLLTEIRRNAPAVTVLVVDDNSPDGTAKHVADIAATDEHVHLLPRPKKEGLGVAYRAGFTWALHHDFDCVITMDADFSHDPAVIPELLRAVSEGADVVIGSRYVPGGSIPQWRWYRRALSRFGNLYAARMLRLRAHDATSGYRAYRASSLEAIDYESVRANGYGFLIEMTYRATRAEAGIVEIPIAFVDRTDGKSKMSSAVIVESMALVTRWGIRDRVQKLRR